MFLAFLADGARELHYFRHVKSHLVLNDLQQGDVRRPEVADIRHQGPAAGASPGGKLADTAGNQVYQNVGVANFLQCFFCQFGVQAFRQRCFESKRRIIDVCASHAMQ